MNDWNIADWACFWLFAFVLFLSSLVGCGTTAVGGVADSIARDSQLRGQLEATVEILDGTVNCSRSRIESVIADSRKIADTAERMDYLFAEYEREVGRLIDEMRRASDKVKDCMEGDMDIGGDIGCVDTPIRRPCDFGKEENH